MSDKWLEEVKENINSHAEVIYAECLKRANSLNVEFEWYVEEFLSDFRKIKNGEGQ